MITFVYGRPGTGKTTLLRDKIVADLRDSKPVVVLVPEQFTVGTEQLLTDAVEAAGDSIRSIGLDVLNFSRLANSVFRTCGGLSYNYIGKGAQTLIMWRALTEAAPDFKEYPSDSAAISDPSFIKLMLSTVKSFKMYGINPDRLDAAAEKLDDTPLKRRVGDLSLIYTLYNHLLHNEYDDPQDDLTRLAETLDEHQWFTGKNVYLDSFDGYTPQELAVLKRIMRQADNVTITFGCLPDEQSICYTKLRDTARTLIRMVGDLNLKRTDDIVLSEYRRFSSPAIAFLSENIWNYASDVTLENHDGISLVECPDIYSECEWAAADILRRVREGARYRDMTVIVRSVDDYDGIIDRIFEKYGIPFFMSRRTELTSRPLYRLMMSALAVLAGGWRCGEVISYIKTGLSGMTPNECSVIENYAVTWNINGRRWYDDRDWSMNPAGYTDIFDESDALLLNEVNQLRAKMTAPLIKLSDSIGRACTVSDACRALYVFLTDLGLPEKLPDDTGDGGNVRVWNAVADALDQLVLTAPELIVNSDRFSRLIEMVLSESDIGRIPATIDEVVIGSADLLRVSGGRGVYVLGVCDGVFPKNVSDVGIFNDAERELLAVQGLELPPGSEERSADELLYFVRAVSSASDFVTVTRYTAELSGKAVEPSLAFVRIKRLFPTLEAIQSSELAPESFIECREAAFDMLYRLRGSAAGEALISLFANDPDFAYRLGIMNRPICDYKERLKPETSKRLFGGDLALTQSRLDRYVLCPFSYGCRYILKMPEKKRASFGSADLGSFIHRVLERYVQLAIKDGRLDTDIERSERERMVDEIIDEYINIIIRDDSDRTPRLMNIFRRLRRVTLLLIEELTREFAQSKFVPRFFELPITYGDENAVRPLRIPLSGGASAYVYGKIDRVDVYRSGNNLYVRVVDYKTGTQEFSLADVELGLNLQMLLYLFAIWQNADGAFKDRLAGEPAADCEVIPAGVLYFNARQGNPEFGLDETEESASETAGAAIKRSGLLIDNAEVLAAMDKELSGRYIPVRFKNDGSPYANCAKSLATLEKFGELQRQIADTVAKIGDEMKSGRMYVKPIRDKKRDSCKYCPDKAVCRYDGNEYDSE